MSEVAPPLVADSISTAVALPPDRAIGSLWPRIVAFVIDGVVVWLPCYGLTGLFFETFSDLGRWGRLAGFCIALPYFAILNSRIGSGQTFGKRWMHLQVVDRNGNTISFLRSLARYVLLGAPYFVNKMHLPMTRPAWIVQLSVTIVIFGLGGATVYLVLFNRHTRQGIHDLAVGGYVAEADGTGPVRCQSIWEWHWMILGGLLVIVFVVFSKMQTWVPVSQMFEDIRQIEGIDGVQAVAMREVMKGKWSFSGGIRTVVITVYRTREQTDQSVLADRVAKVVLQRDQNIWECEALRVIVIRGYDLGITSENVSRSYEYSPAEWNARLFGASAVEGPANNER